MKLNKAKSNRIARPFVKTDTIIITMLKKDNHISGFSVEYMGKKKQFDVVNHKIKAAWQSVEKWLELQK